MRDLTPKHLASAGQIADAIGRSPKAIRAALAEIDPAGHLVRSGNPCAGYSVDQLPAAIRDKVIEQQSQLNYRSPEAVLTAPTRQWQPAIPLAEQPPAALEYAHSLRHALRYYLAHRNDSEIRHNRLLAIAVSHWAEAFGRPVTLRHIKKTISLVLERDRGRDELERLELYLPGKVGRPGRKPAARGQERTLLFIEDALTLVADAGRMSLAERKVIWRAAIDEFEDLVRQGAGEKPAKKAVVRFLQKRAPGLSESDDGLRKQFDRKLAAFLTEGERGLCDKRRDGAAKRQLALYTGPESLSDDERMLLTRANKVGGGLSQAFRDLYLGIEIIPGQPLQFSEDFRARYSFNPRLNKSYVPESLRAKLQSLLRSIKPLNQGPKAARLAAPSIQRDWSKVPAGAWYQSDDETANQYLWFENESGEYEFDGLRFDVIRPQILPMIDTRTDLVLSVLLLPRPQYNSRDIRTLILKTCMDDRIGLPFSGLAFEKGCWSARNVEAMVSWTEIDEGFARAGISLQIRHATTPKAKVIERIFSQEQNAMQELPGYAGRLEMKDCPEITRKSLAAMKRVGQPLKAEAAPWDHFLSADQYLDLLQRAYERFNNEVQNGKRLPGMSPAEGWKAFSPSRPHQVLPDSLRYLLATEQTEVKVSREGIRIRIAGQPRFFFDSGKLGNLIGERMIVRWNSEVPDHVVVVHPRTDPLGQRPFVVRHEPALDAMSSDDEDFGDARSRRKAFLKPQVSLFRMLNHQHNLTVRNELLGSAPLREAGEAHNRVEREEVELKPTREAQATNARKIAHRAGLDPRSIKRPERAAELETFEEIRVRLRAQEQAETE